MRPTHVAVWDLDHTLGDFDTLEELQDIHNPVTVYLRPDIRSALERLIDAGFAHTVLTLASAYYAKLVLRATGLADYFVEVASIGQRPKGDAEGIANDFNIPEEERPDRMVFIGDNPLYDAPSDQRVLFHIEPFALRRSADSLANLILKLREMGDGSLINGFDTIHQMGVISEEVVRVRLEGVGPLLLFPRKDDAPIVCFDEEGLSDSPNPLSVTFIPSDYMY